jgi:hypothetical protein
MIIIVIVCDLTRPYPNKLNIKIHRIETSKLMATNLIEFDELFFRYVTEVILCHFSFKVHHFIHA